MTETEAKQIQTLPEQPVIAQKPRLRRISEHDVEQMAILMSKRVNEAKACSFLGINAHSWSQWKRRMKNASRFEAQLARVQTAKIEANWDLIEKAATKDWRAARELLALIVPDTYGDAQNVSVQVGIYQEYRPDIDKTIARAYDRTKQAQVEGQAAKLLTNPPQDTPK